MKENEFLEIIQKKLTAFDTNPNQATIDLFKTLHYPTDIELNIKFENYEQFKKFVIEKTGNTPNNEKLLTQHWKKAFIPFRISDIELQRKNRRSQEAEKPFLDAYLWFVIELDEKIHYKRTELADFTREINQIFQNGVMPIFKIGQKITLGIIDRRKNKKDDSKNILLKVTFIKDIDIQNPKRSHLEILADLAFDKLEVKKYIKNFIDIHDAWQEILSISELNKKFYKEISNWYFWAVDKCQFPITDDKSQEQTNQIAMIRLLTRFIFVWFIKEKNLVAENLFEENYLNNTLKDFKNGNHYYKAILQNLFFATLNREKTERGFAENKSFVENRTNNDVNTFYRYENLFIDENPTNIMKIFEQTPFLNGGLFDSLDKKDKDKKQYFDGFTRIEKYQASIPDYLFFADKNDSFSNELKTIYGIKNKKITLYVTGIVKILKKYKFTIEENTPLEEDIALDPELLGQIFESLLASYDENTASTARNSSGSFYTPREIVNYMVDESLLEFLVNSFEKDKGFEIELGAQQTSAFDVNESKKGQLAMSATIINEPNKDILKENFRQLINNQTEKSPFTTKQNKEVLEKIYTKLKILDPACGSGAFPMGILDKLVQILKKLDANNDYFRQIVINKTKHEKESIIQSLKKDKEIINHLSDNEVKNKAQQIIDEKIKQIENDFNTNLNTDNYARKLYLVQNCIYGIDIQNIAIQISKLRFFLSLVIEQKNENIKPLPNLETKFVTANTLIGLDKPKKQAQLKNLRLDKLEIDLAENRQKYFAVKNKTQKNQFIQKDKELRTEIAMLLEKDGWGKATAQKIADFDLFDQNASADWFDMELMFGIKDGFDIVLGNPPYVQLQKMQGSEIFAKQNFKTYSKSSDLYCLFYEKGNQLLKEKGLLCLITSNKWMRAGYGEKLREFLAIETNPLLLIDLGAGVFESATVDTNILMFEKNNEKNKNIQVKAVTYQKNNTDIPTYFRENHVILNQLTKDAWTISNSKTQKVKQQIEKIGIPLKDWDISIYRGLLTGFNEAFIIDEAKKNELISQDPKSAEIIKPILRGRDIKTYSYEFAGLYLIVIPSGWTNENRNKEDAEIFFKNTFPAVYNHFKEIANNQSSKGKGLYNRDDQGQYWWELRSCSYMDEFLKEKIIWAEMTSGNCFVWDDNKIFCNQTCYFIPNGNKFLLSVLNSKLVYFYFTKIATDLGNSAFRWIKQFIEKIPIPQISKEQQKPFEVIVDYILWLNEHKHLLETSKDRVMSIYFGALIDLAVIELYFENELKKSNRDILQYLVDLVPLPVSSEIDILNTIRDFYNIVSHPKNIVATNLFYSGSVSVVSIIRGQE